MRFSPDSVYLVFAYGKTPETMKARDCTFTAPLQYTQVPEVLDRLVQRRQPSALVSSQQWVVVIGDVATPGLVEWREGMTVEDAVKVAGGRVPVRHPQFASPGRSSKIIRWKKTRDEHAALPTTPLLPDDELVVGGEKWPH